MVNSIASVAGNATNLGDTTVLMEVFLFIVFFFIPKLTFSTISVIGTHWVPILHCPNQIV